MSFEYLNMSLIKVKDRLVYMNSERERMVMEVLQNDFTNDHAQSAKTSDNKVAVDFKDRIIAYLSQLHEESKEQFDFDWAYISYSGDEAAHQVTDIIADWCSLHPGYSLIDERLPKEKYMDARAGWNKLYPLGKSFKLGSSPTPNYVKLLDWSPLFTIRINCDEVDMIEGEIDTIIAIYMHNYTINLTDKVEIESKFS